MTAPVRLRGSVGERRREGSPVYGLDRRRDRRGDKVLDPAQVAARVDECIAAAREPLLRLIEEQAAEIERLTLQLNQHMDEVVHLTGTLAHRDKEIANLCHVMTYDPTKLAAGAGAGEVAGE